MSVMSVTRPTHVLRGLTGMVQAGPRDSTQSACPFPPMDSEGASGCPRSTTRGNSPVDPRRPPE